MSHSETSSQALHSSSLVLVAPMPRRPIALVARRHHHHHHHHHHHSSSNSRSRSSRTVSSAGGKPTDDAANPVERAISPSQSNGAGASVRMVGHPYSRAKTPSNASSVSNPVSPAAAALAGVTGWPLGLGISPVSPPPRSRTGSRDGLASRPLSRLSSRDNAPLSSAAMALTASDAAGHYAPSNLETIPDASAGSTPLAEQFAHESSQADELMMSSALVSPPIGSGAAVMDLERTPTKSKARSHQRAEKGDQEPRSTPTIGAAEPHPQDGVHSLTLSPTTPMEQRITAAASASAQLSLSLSSPPALPAAVADSVGDAADKLQTSPRRVEAMVAVSVAPSPCLSESVSRSPSASPSPCPSPALDALLDLPPPAKHADEPRKMGLPPLPSSPIPRKMTRNPFERYLSVDGTESGCALHARLAMAMGRGAEQQHARSVLEGMQARVQEGEADHEMAERAVSPELVVGRPALVRGESGMRMDMDE